jgi:amino acid transporter
MSLLVIISVLGALTGMIFTGSRLFCEVGRDHRLFAVLGRRHPRWQTPVWSLLIQAGASIAMLVAVPVIWPGEDPFNALLKCTSPVFWLFFGLTALGLIILRSKDRTVERPFRVPLYPLVPLAFFGWCGFMLFGSLREAWLPALVGLGILVAGLPLYALSGRVGQGPGPIDSLESPARLVNNEGSRPPGGPSNG